MAALVSFLSIAFGAILTLAGLLMIAPQVRVHQIEIYSRGSWIFRAGILFTIFGLIVLLVSDGIQELGQVGLVVGVAAVMGGVITWGHEWRQAREQGNVPWNWARSLTLQMILLGAAALALAIFSTSA